ncbi:PadR family transcriptional regulator [Cellulosimicrobium cellulans]|uniref:PadR family transcriptional regulator n=1 Tax=Cellulosimicrobium cellulans TaxID=1710 RepID=UPI0020980555|nr:PadR family transcriptional regulator [Cellulosimicrobium cellulans]MCO7274051.1 PadR family transcriptional regulator [Cellulosimicrobium cellulans]
MSYAHQHRGRTPENVQNMSQPFGERPGPRPDRRRRDGFPPVPDDAAWFRGDGPRGRGGARRGGGRGFGGPADGGRGFGPGSGERGFGPGFGPGGPGFGPGGPGFGPGHGGRRHGGRGRGPGRAGRGDVRAAVLLLLAEQPMHGYQVIQEIAERSEGQWRPSPGAVYPALNLLQDEGLVELSADGGRRLATLTEAGTAYVAEHAAELGDPFAEAAGRGGRSRRELRAGVEAVAAAVHQVARTGTDEQAQAAAELLERTRRELYLILAGPAATTPAPDAGAPASSGTPVEDAPVEDAPSA